MRHRLRSHRVFRSLFPLVTIILFLGPDYSAVIRQQPPTSASAAEGLWSDVTPSYTMVDAGHRWHCSTNGWLYIGSSSSASSSSGSIACTTPVGNDLGWSGGNLVNLHQSGMHVSFERSNGGFGNLPNGCLIVASITAKGLSGRQTCMFKYVDPFGMTGHAEARVQGPYEATRASFDGPELPALNCAQERSLKPQGLASGTMVLFQNSSNQALMIFPLNSGNQLNSDNQRVRAGNPLPANGTFVQAIPVSNPIVLTTASGKCLAVYEPTDRPAKAHMP